MRPDTVKSAGLLREARLRAGLSQLALAERAGKDRVQIGRWEAGAVAPSLDTLVDLVRACGFDIPLELAPLRPVEDERLTELQRLSPERRLDFMLGRLGDGGGSVMAGPEKPFDPRAILAALERNRVAYVLIGGLARVLRGADEITRGVDICPTFASANLERLGRAVTELDARGAHGRTFVYEQGAIDAAQVLALRTRFGALNIVGTPAGVPGGYLDVRRAATREHLGYGLQPFVASAGDLARMAAALRRDQDVARLPALRRIMELEVDRAQTIASPAASSPSLDRRRQIGPQTLRRGPRLTP